MALQFSGQVIEKKYSNIKFHKNPSDGSPFAPRVWIYRRAWSLFTILQERIKMEFIKITVFF